MLGHCIIHGKIYNRFTKIKIKSMKSLYDFFFFYIPFKVHKYYDGDSIQKFSTYIAVVVIISLNLFSIYFIGSVYIGSKLFFFDNDFLNKFIGIPLLLSPVFLFTYFFYKRNEVKYEEYFVLFESYPLGKKKKKQLLFWCFIVFTFAFFLSSITSPLWIK